MTNTILIVLGKLVLLISKSLNLGSGSTWPGHIAMEINPRFIKQILVQNQKLKVIIVAGTNGKTTTSTLLKHILKSSGLKVFQNEAGANLLNGIASSIISNSSLFGNLEHDAAVFEIDENNLRFILKEVKPYAVVLLNIFRDQLDRYGEVNKVVKDWETAFVNIPSGTMLFINGDDPELSFMGHNSKHKTYFFGVEEKLMAQKEIPHDVDFIYCPNCQTKLEYEKMSYSHMGKFKCPKCGFTNPNTETFPTLPYPLFGTYNIYNTNAAALVASKAFGVSKDKIRKALEDFKPAFGRQEIIKYKGRNVLILLSKNPAGFNQSIDAVISRLNLKKQPRTAFSAQGSTLNRSTNILLVLNDRIPDGRDVSWIWDVDTEELFKISNNITISGDRCYDMDLRMKYCSETQNSKIKIIENLKNAVNEAVKATGKDETLFILPTYSAMLEVRKILLGRKLL